MSESSLEVRARPPSSAVEGYRDVETGRSDSKLDVFDDNENASGSGSAGGGSSDGAENAEAVEAAAVVPNKSARMRKIILALLLVGFIVFVIVDSTTNGYIRDGIQTFLQWVEDNPVAGFFVFMGVYFIATILFVPGLILTLGSGFVFSNSFGMGLGLVVATISVFVGASLGSVVAFIFGRFILRDWVKGLAYKYPVFRAIDRALEEKGLRIMVLLRLSPIIPFNALNYISGITAVSLKHYSIALFAILPGTIIYVFLGASANSLANLESSTESAALSISIVVIGVVLGIIAIVATSRYAKKGLNRILVEERGEDASNEQKDGGKASAPNSDAEGGEEKEEDQFDEEKPDDYRNKEQNNNNDDMLFRIKAQGGPEKGGERNNKRACDLVFTSWLDTLESPNFAL